MTTTARIDRFVDWFIRSDFLERRRFGSSSDMWIEDPERAERCERAAEYGGDGSTHYEVIQDWREGFADWLRYGGRRNPWSKGYDRFEAAVCAHFDAVEAWHDQHGSLHQEIG